MKFFLLLLSILLFVSSFQGSAKAATTVTNVTTCTATPDVVLNVSRLGVERISLNVSNLKANLNLNAAVGSLVTLTAGVDVSIDNVNLEIDGVEAQALLTVRLDNVRAIISDTLSTLEKNPNLLTGKCD